MKINLYRKLKEFQSNNEKFCRWYYFSEKYIKELDNYEFKNIIHFTIPPQKNQEAIEYKLEQNLTNSKEIFNYECSIYVNGKQFENYKLEEIIRPLFLINDDLFCKAEIKNCSFTSNIGR